MRPSPSPTPHGSPRTDIPASTRQETNVGLEPWKRGTDAPKPLAGISDNEGAQSTIRSLEIEALQPVPQPAVPSNRKALRGKLVCRLKHNKLGISLRHKVCWVAKGFQQVWGRDHTDTTSPTARLESEQYDVKTAFLNGILPDGEVQFMEQPPDFSAPRREHHVRKLRHGRADCGFI